MAKRQITLQQNKICVHSVRYSTNEKGVTNSIYVMKRELGEAWPDEVIVTVEWKD